MFLFPRVHPRQRRPETLQTSLSSPGLSRRLSLGSKRRLLLSPRLRDGSGHVCGHRWMRHEQMWPELCEHLRGVLVFLQTGVCPERWGQVHPCSSRRPSRWVNHPHGQEQHPEGLLGSAWRLSLGLGGGGADSGGVRLPRQILCGSTSETQRRKLSPATCWPKLTLKQNLGSECFLWPLLNLWRVEDREEEGWRSAFRELFKASPPTKP